MVNGLLVFGLLVAAAGFLAAAIDPATALRALPWSLPVGPLAWAPLAVALVLTTLAAVKLWWRAPVAAAVVLTLLIGSAVMSPAPLRPFAHPGDFFGFLSDWLQLAGELTAAAAALVATAQIVGLALRRRRRPPVVLLSPADRWVRATVAAIRRGRATGVGGGSK